MTQVTEAPAGGQLSNEQLKEMALKNFERAQAANHMFPTERIELPSKGILYPEDNPLSSGVIEMRYMTAKDEDILMSPNLIKSGGAIDKLLRSLIVSPIEYDDLLIADKNEVLIAARILAYGKDYVTTVTCPDCGEKKTVKFDLTEIKNKDVEDESIYVRGKNEFTFVLPVSGKTVTFRLLTHGDDQAIDEEVKKMRQYTKASGIDPTLSTRLFYSIISVDGVTDRQKVRKEAETMLSMDSKALRGYIAKISPTVDLRVAFDCDNCGYADMVDIPIDVNFFWPKA